MRAFRSLFFAALIAAIAAGLAASVVQAVRLWPLIDAAEVLESAAASHHDHAAGEAGWTPSGPLRPTLTVVFNITAALGFGLILNALARVRCWRTGRALTVRDGLLWGAAGFAACSLAPAFGLPPELPGMEAGPLLYRQVWWVATVLCTGGGIALLAFVRSSWRFAGLGLILLPHLIGAPHSHAHGSVPGEMAAAFAAASLGASAVFWLVLGSVSGWAQQLFDGER